MNFDPNKPRCFLIYALAPERTPIQAADLAFNKYISEPRRGLVIWHDHFVDCAGGAAISFVDGKTQYQMLFQVPELPDWMIRAHPLTFSDSGQGFLGQIDFTLERYRHMSVKELRTAGNSRWAKEPAEGAIRDEP